jgi:LysM repeat protein
LQKRLSTTNRQHPTRILGVSALILTLATATLLVPSFAIAQDSYEAWLEKDQAEFDSYNAETTAAYDKYMKEELEAYDAFLKEAGAKWGKENIWMPKQAEWVQYRDDLEERSSVDFESGMANVEVMVPADADENSINDALADAVETLMLSGSIGPIEMMHRKLFGAPKKRKTVRQHSRSGAATSTPTIYTVQKGDNLWKLSRKFKISRQALASANGISPDDWLKIGQKLKLPGTTATAARSTQTKQPDLRLASKGSAPLLSKQVTMSDGTAVTPANSRQFSEQVAAKSQKTRTPIKGDDGKSRHVVKAQFPLVSDHVRIRAERFRPLVTQYSRKYDVYAPLVYAIMQSESSFNPRARSGVPAYGLMQLVPRSGARDAYRYVHKQDKLVSGSYLYNPRNNIELGTAFLHILDKRYFKRVDNATNRMLCSVAAYNTGAGNVCRAFGAGTSLSRAAPIINRMTPKQVYAKLCRDLPYAETRNYMVKVTDRMPLYDAWK